MTHDAVTICKKKIKIACVSSQHMNFPLMRKSILVLSCLPHSSVLKQERSSGDFPFVMSQRTDAKAPFTNEQRSSKESVFALC